MQHQVIKSLLSFIKGNPTAYHVSRNIIDTLEKEGFVPFLAENFKNNKRFYLYRDGTTIAFVLPDIKSSSIKTQQINIRMAVAHTDSPGLILRKQNPEIQQNHQLLRVEPYGGVMLPTWLDRTLSIAGRIFIQIKDKLHLESIKKHIKNKEKTRTINIYLEHEINYSNKESICILPILFQSKRPTATIPNLAIHLNKEAYKNITIDPQEHIYPLWDTQITQYKSIEKWLASEIDIEYDLILSHDIRLYDLQEPISFENSQLFQASCIDNQAMCHAIIHGFIQSIENIHSNRLAIAAFFNHEEIGSQTHVGADSSLLSQVILEIEKQYKINIYNKLLLQNQALNLSCDMAHGLHPNYSNKHDSYVKPLVNQGPVVKINEGKRYSTDAAGIAFLKILCESENIPFQIYHHHNDIPCGSTVGPITASKQLIPTIDIGNAMWSMHSIRETAGIKDQKPMIDLIRFFYQK